MDTYSELTALPDSKKNSFKEIPKVIFEKAIKHVHKSGGFSPTMLQDEPIKELINATYEILSESIRNINIQHEVSQELKDALVNNVYHFSGFKTYHQAKQASQMLANENGEIKPFDTFYKDVQKIDKVYNRLYLQAEYNHALAATESAVKWQEIAKDGDKFNLQYRTAADERVREDHQALHGTTLPPSDPFWNSFMPPNGWNCRCNAVQVRKEQYETSSSDEAVRKGNNCTATPKQQIFRFNPGQQGKIYPDKHPYFPKDCGNCKRGFKALGYKPNREACKACGAIEENSKANKKKELDKRDLEILATFKEGEKHEYYGANLQTGKLVITKKAVENYLWHAYSNPSKELILKIGSDVKKLKSNNDFAPLITKGKSKKNIERKMKRGVIGYSTYSYETKGIVYVIGMENIKNKYETPYFTAVKRKKP